MLLAIPVQDPDHRPGMTTDGATTHFEPHPACSAGARRFVVGHLGLWGLDRFHDAAALCASELATNAILHCRSPFTVAVRAIPAGVRVDVQDDRPDRLPAQLPPGVDPLASGTTGRGLKLVSAMSNRWGYFTTDVAKTVWVELNDNPAEGFSEPLVELATRPAPDKDRPVRLVRLVGLPVRAAIASGVQMDDLVREVQLQPERMDSDDLAVFHELLDRSAAPRLIGRQEAFRAAAKGLDEYSLELAVSVDELGAVGELVALLQRLAEVPGLEAGRVAAEVEVMRAWIPGEVAAQYAGRAPTPFPGAVVL